MEKKNGWKIKKTNGIEFKQNEDFITVNEELITLLKRKIK